MEVGHTQLVWWGLRAWPWRAAALGPYPERGRAMGTVYRWRILLGPLEVRRWAEASMCSWFRSRRTRECLKP